MKLPRFTVLRMMLVVAFVALIAALFVQDRDSKRKLARARAELNDFKSLIPDGYTMASASLIQSKIEGAGDRVVIATVGSVMDRKPNPAFVWAVKILEAEGRKVVFRKRYDGRVFHPGRGEVANPVFVEILQPPIPAGDYRVKVTLYEVPSVGGLAALDREEYLDGFAVMSSAGRVTLKPKE